MNAGGASEGAGRGGRARVKDVVFADGSEKIVRVRFETR